MSDLTDDRVREWANYYGVEDMVTVVARDLAREVLALRAKLTEAVAVAQEAVELIHPMNKYDKRTLRARLAALQEER